MSGSRQDIGEEKIFQIFLSEEEWTNMLKSHSGIRPNPVGDWPQIDSTSFVDPSAQIIGNVRIGPKVYVGPQAVIRADEVDSHGKVHPLIIKEESLIQDGVIIHARAGSSMPIGPGANIAHGVIIHGPCEIGKGCFVALRAAIYSSTLEEEVWIGIGSVVMRTTISSHTMIPAGSIIRSGSDISQFRITNVKEEEYKRHVFETSGALRDGYLELYSKGMPEKGSD
jgi:carbonic anhydrase/acetyltransferase-like protein (isoleucine patch superfamily)